MKKQKGFVSAMSMSLILLSVFLGSSILSYLFLVHNAIH